MTSAATTPKKGLWSQNGEDRSVGKDLDPSWMEKGTPPKRPHRALKVGCLTIRRQTYGELDADAALVGLVAYTLMQEVDMERDALAGMQRGGAHI